MGHLVYASKISPLGQVFHTNLFVVLSAMKEGHYRVTVVSGSVATLLGPNYSSPKRTLYHHSHLRSLGPALVQPEGSVPF